MSVKLIPNLMATSSKVLHVNAVNMISVFWLIIPFLKLVLKKSMDTSAV